MNHEDPRPLDGLDGEAPEALRRALRALAREQPSQATLSAAALRLESTLDALDHGGLSAAVPRGRSTLALKLLAGALVLGGTTLALRPSRQAQVTHVEPAAAALSSPARQVPVERKLTSTPTEVTHVVAPTETPEAQAPAPMIAPAAPVRRAPMAAHKKPPVNVLTTSERVDAQPVATNETVAPVAQALSQPSVQVSSLGTLGREERPAATPNTELTLLLDARKHAADDPEATLRATAEHARRFPAGALAPEREVLAIRALRALGRRSEAAQRVVRFRAAYPDSVHLSGLEEH